MKLVYTSVLCLLMLEAIVAFNKNEFRTIQGYLKNIYGPKRDTAYKRWFDTKLDSYGYVEYDVRRNNIVVAFRGSASITNWLNNLQMDLVSSGDCNGCKVHKGFLATYRSARNFVLQTVENFRKAHPSAKVYVTGHSLGGAQAVLLTVDLYKRGIQANLMTFGCPRPGNEVYSNYVNPLVRGMNYRVTYMADKVPILPIRLLGYKHVGTEVHVHRKLDGNFWYRIEPRFQDKTDPLRLYNVIDHISGNYFNARL